MKLTKSTLKQIIKEEINKLLKEQTPRWQDTPETQQSERTWAMKRAMEGFEDVDESKCTQPPGTPASYDDLPCLKARRIFVQKNWDRLKGARQTRKELIRTTLSNASSLHRALEGLGTDESALEEILSRYINYPDALRKLIKRFNNLDEVRNQKDKYGGLIKWLKDDGEHGMAARVQAAASLPRNPLTFLGVADTYGKPPTAAPPQAEKPPAEVYDPGKEKIDRALVTCWTLRLTGLGKNIGEEGRIRATCKEGGCFRTVITRANKKHKGKWVVKVPHDQWVVPCKK